MKKLIYQITATTFTKDYKNEIQELVSEPIETWPKTQAAMEEIYNHLKLQGHILDKFDRRAGAANFTDETTYTVYVLHGVNKKYPALPVTGLQISGLNY